jgi:hypothetical protein
VASRTARTDYRLQRRALLGEVRAGQRPLHDVRDAHPDLVRAGANIGTPARDACPLCEEPQLVHVAYVFEGKRSRSPSGRAVPRDSLARQAERHGDLRVYTVEVCLACHWHHLVESYLLLATGTAAS